MTTCILQIGDFKGASALGAATQKAKLKLLLAKDLPQAIEIAAKHPIAMAFADTELGLPNLFTTLNDNQISLPVVACGPAQPVQNAVKAIRLGAIEYLSTPVEETLITALFDKITPPETADFTPIHGDPKTIELLEQAKQFAASNATVLLRGESGTGKEVFSRYIHNHSPRNNNEFIAVNCAAIPENLLESELFGHEKGAFSGAVGKRLGKFQQADKGTLLLDEISEMDLPLQAKLLRAIQERVIDPVGSTQPVPVDIRLIATTNRQLEEYVAEGKFREDLYFRLNVVALEIPPLRERPGDIEPLANHFATQYGNQNGLTNLTISAEALKKLQECYWKGNVRELENTIHRAVLMMGTDTTMQPAHIVLSPMSLQMMDAIEPANQQAAQAAGTGPLPTSTAAAQRYAAASGNFQGGTGANKSEFVGKSLADVEKELILSTITYCQGNRQHAATILGISIQQLKKKLDTYDTAA